MRKLLIPVLILLLAGCQSAYYGAAEKLGFHKRDILMDRVEDSRDAQVDAQEQFQSALEQLSSLTNFDGGDLEDMYNELSDEYEKSEQAATEVHERIEGVENVAGALFKEWEDEIEEFSNASMKADSRAKLRDTRQRYDAMIAVLRTSEAKMDPVLTALKDNVLYLKHNLNARAVASLKVEFRSIEADIDLLIQEMHKAIAASDAFIASMQ
jgi:DNA repair exonuclease SbcCD ATPase subunit